MINKTHNIKIFLLGRCIIKLVLYLITLFNFYELTYLNEIYSIL